MIIKWVKYVIWRVICLIIRQYLSLMFLIRLLFVGVGLSYVIEYLGFDTTQTQPTNTNCQPYNQSIIHPKNYTITMMKLQGLYKYKHSFIIHNQPLQHTCYSGQ